MCSEWKRTTIFGDKNSFANSYIAQKKRDIKMDDIAKEYFKIGLTVF